ncbi:small integral membrane protein 12 [Diachasmimorpha longicaudata]|uniref:small integral membrane protein 12 n=1 Tax=Diachasmimorpha longicaudata TaxID=58733 RepID=UPI0030B873EC
MWPWVMGVLRRYIPMVTLPFAGVVGVAGYYVEGWLSDRYTPATAPVKDQREDRLLENIDTGVAKKKHNPLEVNLSPSLAS